MKILEWLILNFEKTGTATIIASIIALFAAYIAYISTKKKTAIETITKSRIEWIQQVRVLAGEINQIAYSISKETMLIEMRYNPATIECILPEDQKFYKGQKLIKLLREFSLYFNPDSDKDNEIMSALKNVENILADSGKDLATFNDIDKHMIDFNRKLAYYLKTEWEVAKNEARKWSIFE